MPSPSPSDLSDNGCFEEIISEKKFNCICVMRNQPSRIIVSRVTPCHVHGHESGRFAPVDATKAFTQPKYVNNL